MSPERITEYSPKLLREANAGIFFFLENTHIRGIFLDFTVNKNKGNYIRSRKIAQKLRFSLLTFGWRKVSGGRKITM